MVDGLDGSGKGTVINTLKKHLEEKGKKVFDLREHCKQHTAFPEFKEIKDYDVIVSTEPTYSYIGKAIREEIVKESERKYSEILEFKASLEKSLEELLNEKVIIRV